MSPILSSWPFRQCPAIHAVVVLLMWVLIPVEEKKKIDNGKYGTRTVRFETGRLAQQAQGAVAAYLDEETMLLSATSAGKVVLQSAHQCKRRCRWGIERGFP